MELFSLLNHLDWLLDDWRWVYSVLYSIGEVVPSFVVVEYFRPVHQGALFFPSELADRFSLPDDLVL
jgi:hypothetical protein